MSTRKPISIVFKLNNVGVTEPCALCGYADRANTPLDAFVEGTWDRVCPECLDRQEGLPGLCQALDIMSGLVILLFQGKSLDTVRRLVDEQTGIAQNYPSCFPEGETYWPEGTLRSWDAPGH